MSFGCVVASTPVVHLLVASACAVVFAEPRSKPSVAEESQPRVSIDELSIRGTILSRRDVRYPEEALRRGIAGVVVVQVLVDTSGKVASTRVLESPDPSLGRAATDAVSDWTFRVIKAGRGPTAPAAQVETKLTFYFRRLPSGAGRIDEPTPESSGESKPLGPIHEMAFEEWRASRRPAGTILLDIRSRDHFATSHTEGALSMPADEVAVRTRELKQGSPIAIECYPTYEALCRRVARSVAQMSAQVTIVIR